MVIDLLLLFSNEGKEYNWLSIAAGISMEYALDKVQVLFF